MKVSFFALALALGVLRDLRPGYGRKPGGG
jgi:hypothetical protein